MRRDVAEVLQKIASSHGSHTNERRIIFKAPAASIVGVIAKTKSDVIYWVHNPLRKDRPGQLHYRGEFSPYCQALYEELFRKW